MPKQPTSTDITAHRHADKRANIPTEELRDFVARDEHAPKTLRYPRDPSLDPQLVWQGKDEQDAADLAVPAVPIYIQEKIHPQSIINDLLAQAARPGSALREQAAVYQLNLFADFNGGPEEFEQKVEFYQHEQNWTNRLILGDSLLVMASLAEKEGLRGKVQTIYLDPPYGIKFGSNWQVSTRKRDVKDGKAEDATRQPEQIRAFRDTWQLGIHSYLAYLRDRLTVARELLTETGSVFVQIGDENVHLVRCVLDEVFGSENFCTQIIFRKTTTQSGDILPATNDYLLWYAKNKEMVKYRTIYQERQGFEWVNYDYLLLPSGETQRLSGVEKSGDVELPVGASVYRRSPLTSLDVNQSTSVPFEFSGKVYSPGNGHWKTSIAGIRILGYANRLEAYGTTLSFRRFVNDFPFFPISDTWSDTATGGYADPKVYVVQTNTKVIERCLLMTTDPGDLVLDPTCGSGTTAYVAEQWGRRWITCDTSRVALALARTRLMAAKYPYYLLADSPEGLEKEHAQSGGLWYSGVPQSAGLRDIRRGFVYKRVPHVTLKSIANNAEIDAIHARWQAQLDPLAAQLNTLLGQTWDEWQIPRDLAPLADELAKAAHNPGLAAAIRNPQSPIRNLHAQYWQARRDRQAEIDASIAGHADTETLYDQPYEDNKRIRVCGPFSVESLSPHRVLPTDDGASHLRASAPSAADFTTMILDNLRKAGVQNTRKAERLTFDRLDPYPGAWLHATGETTETSPLLKSGEGSGVRARRVAVSIGPEHGTVGPQHIKEAAKEAVQGVGFDLLIVCGFAFDPHVSEEIKRYGALTVLPTKMNPDLAMGDELLKKTGAGNLFMVFGEPDVDITKQGDGQLIVEIKGVDVYDPTTGQIRNSSTDDIACWFIDTDYDGESFFVRHAYFTGADQPYDKLKRALRAEIDEAAWSALYSTVSRPFARPASGKIAVKVINHYGDEVLKVFTV
ncbi:MAG: site-specific DNA-methyltransferase [Chloroflexi bacterium]|nr:site-specific DNA-methyltransferase [Chloroflexota bacterium]